MKCESDAMKNAAHTNTKFAKVRDEPRQGPHRNPQPKRILALESQ